MGLYIRNIAPAYPMYWALGAADDDDIEVNGETVVVEAPQTSEEGRATLPEVPSEAPPEEITREAWMLPVPIAQQIYSIVPGVAGGLAAFILAAKLSNAREVNATEVLLATGLVAAVTFGSIFLIRTVKEFD